MGIDSGRDLGSDLGILIQPPAQLEGKKDVCGGPTIRRKRYLFHLSTNSGSSGTRLQHTTTTIIARLKVIQSCCTVLKDTTEMGLLMDNCRLAYTKTGRLVGRIARILSVYCQMIYRDREKNFGKWKIYSMFFISEIVIQQGNFKG